MFNMKYLSILLVVVIGISSLMLVSAEDTSSCLNDTISNENIYIDDEVLSTDNDCKTFKELNKTVYLRYNIDLACDYAFNESTDNVELKKGIHMSHEVIFNGHGHTIYGNGATIFEIDEGVRDVKIYNLNFVNTFSKDYLTTYTGNLNEYGGAIRNYGDVYLENCTFINNAASKYGGAIYNADYSTTNLYINNCTFINNTIPYYNSEGGAIYSSGRLTIVDSKFHGCYAAFGGAIMSKNESYIRNCIFTNNSAGIYGGAVSNQFSRCCDIYNSSFYFNSAQFGGAVSGAIVRQSYFDSNNASSKNGNNIFKGVVFNCTPSGDFNDYYNTSNSKGFILNPLKLSFNNGGEGKTLDISVINNPDRCNISGVSVKINIISSSGEYKEFVRYSGENGLVNVPLSGLKNGVYTVYLSFLIQDYNCTEANYTLFLGDFNSKIHFSTGLIFEYGSVGTVYVTVEGGTVERKNIKILNYPKAIIDLINNEIQISGLDVGSYKLEVKSTPNEYYSESVATLAINVKKATAVIKASKVTVALKKGTYWQVTIIDSKTGKGIANMAVSLKVYTGKKYKIVKVTTNSRGIASYKTSKLVKGNHKVVVSATHKSYDFNTLTSSIKVVKPKKIVISAKKKTYKKGSSLSIIVKDKATKKGLNGVKIKLLIYDGKKVKSVVLKTKKVGKNKGYAGYSTNELSVGKHKVKIVPVDVKYDGSKTSSMTIKKSAKKYPAESTKVSG